MGTICEVESKIHFSRMEGLSIELFIMIIFRIFIYINYRVKSLTVTKYKIIYNNRLTFFAVDILVLVCNYSWIIMAS